MKKTAIIVGANGQDGRVLFSLLSAKAYTVIGIHKEGVRTHGIEWNKQVDISNPEDVFQLVREIQPDEIYHLAAFHHSSQDEKKNELELLRNSYDVHVLSLAHFLEAIKLYSQESRIFYASSSLIFGRSAYGLQTEQSQYRPDTIYGISKLDGQMLCGLYRNTHNIFAAAGIFFNHESTYRKKKFVSRKIIQGAIDIKNNRQDVLKIGSLDAEVDWGYAPDYVEAAHRILSAPVADDFIIATGEKHSVRDFVKIAFEYFNMNWEEYVVEDTSVLSRKREAVLGDASKLRQVTGWEPSLSFEEMIIKIITQLDT